MTIHEIEAKSLLRRQRKMDSWFVSRLGMNLYRGCMHNCVYCDGRAEKYQTSGDFGREIEVKINAAELLKRELSSFGKRKPFPGGFIMIGGGVSDSYQQIEKKYRLSRKALQIVAESGRPAHLLTKSTLIREDLELIKSINERSRAIVSFSFSSVNDALSAKLEPGVPPPSERLAVLKEFKEQGIATGLFLMPVIPFITDTPDQMKQVLHKAVEARADFVIFGGLTLKDGRQKDYFLEFLRREYPETVAEYHKLYKGSPWGSADGEYFNQLHQCFRDAAIQYPVPLRIPVSLFGKFVSPNDRIIVILEQIDYLMKMQGLNSPYGKAAWALCTVQESISSLLAVQPQIKHVSPNARKLIDEILETGTSSEYERLLNRAHKN